MEAAVSRRSRQACHQECLGKFGLGKRPSMSLMSPAAHRQFVGQGRQAGGRIRCQGPGEANGDMSMSLVTRIGFVCMIMRGRDMSLRRARNCSLAAFSGL
jgi:hypothetical protein